MIERDHHHPAAAEVLLAQPRPACEHRDGHRHHQDRTEREHLADDRPAAVPEHPPSREGPAELLLERQEEAGRDREGGEPQADHRLEGVVAAEGDLADPEEGEAADPCDQEPDGDGDRALRERHSSR